MNAPSCTRRRFLAITAASGALGLTLHEARAMDMPLRRWRGTALGAEAEITLYHADQREADRLIGACLGEIERQEQVFSLYRPDSALCHLNRDGELCDPPFDLVRLLSDSARLSEISGGAFDVTVQPLWGLYAGHFQRPNADPSGPSKVAIEQALGRVDYHAITIAADRIAFARPGMAVTLNGIAQGYVTDRVADLLQRQGVEHVLVDLDEVRAIGPRADGSPWRVGIADPRRPERALKTIALVDGSFGTSGGYGTTFDASGRFNHLIDPATGGCANRYLSVSVASPLAATCDGLSTALSVMPPERAQASLAAMGPATATFVMMDGSLVTCHA